MARQLLMSTTWAALEKLTRSKTADNTPETEYLTFLMGKFFIRIRVGTLVLREMQVQRRINHPNPAIQ
jgi:hypothetical protein